MSCRLRIALVWFCAIASASGQSADDLVKSLLNPPMTPQLQLAMVAPTCAGDPAAIQREKRIKDELGAMGDVGIPALERAMDRIEKTPGPLPRGMLFSTYAEIAGRRAYLRLRAMISNPQLHPEDHFSLDRAIAVAHGLTSYVDPLRGPTGLLLCREHEPKEALDDLVVASETGNRNLLTASLGPEALPAVGTGKIEKGSALGYKFRLSDAFKFPDSITIETDFENASGVHCGTSAITFLKVDHPDFHGRKKYVVDNSDPRPLLNLIAGCSSDPTRR